MCSEVKTVRAFGFRLFDIGGRFKTKTIAVITIAIFVIALCASLFFVLGTKNVKGKVNAHLKANGVEISEISDMMIRYSFKKPFC